MMCGQGDGLLIHWDLRMILNLILVDRISSSNRDINPSINNHVSW